MQEIKVIGAGGEYMDAVVVAEWHVKIGDYVHEGDTIVTVETAKAATEIEAPVSGSIAAILMVAGTEAAVGSALGLIDDGAPSGRGIEETELVKDLPALVESGRQPKNADRNVDGLNSKRIVASPLARREAKQSGVDLALVEGSGPHRRIVSADIAAALAKKTAEIEELVPQAASPPAATSTVTMHPAGQLKSDYRIEPLSKMRQTIARRTTEAKQTMPHFYLTVDCVVDGLMELKSRFQSHPGGIKLSINDFVIRAAAAALKKVPAANASYADTGILYYDTADISVAVATPGGLITPIIRNAERRGLADISLAMRDLAGRARDGKLKPHEYQGGTFSISNLGMFGIKQFDAIINPPQACILAVGACEPRPVVKNGGLAVATIMSVTLSIDHRVVDGAIGAEWLRAFKTFVEDPLIMML